MNSIEINEGKELDLIYEVTTPGGIKLRRVICGSNIRYYVDGKPVVSWDYNIADNKMTIIFGD